MSEGVRSLLAPWIGGAASPQITTQYGYRSMLAFWIGGACNDGAAPPVVAYSESPFFFVTTGRFMNG